MRNLILFIVIYITSVPVYCQSAQGRYASRMTNDGTIFFINPQKLGTLENIKRFEYDMTLLSWTDSITVNFTFESSYMSVPESLEIISDGDKYRCDNYSVLFIDIKKKHYEIRITSKFSAYDIYKIIKSKSSPVFCLYQNNIKETASYKGRSWKKDRKKLYDIYQLYLYSKKQVL